LVGGLSNECPCDQILSFGKSDLWKCVKSCSDWKVSLFELSFRQESIFFLSLLGGLKVFHLFVQIIDWLFQRLSFAYFSEFFYVKSLFNWSKELRFDLNLQLNHLNLSSLFMINGKGYLFFRFFKCLNKRRHPNVFKNQLFFKELRLWRTVNDTDGESLFAHRIDLYVIAEVLEEKWLLSSLHESDNFVIISYKRFKPKFLA
jgi:hypothetical protein